jgi:hypothetical protein
MASHSAYYMFAQGGSERHPIAVPGICLQKVFLKVKILHLMTMRRAWRRAWHRASTGVLGTSWAVLLM